MWGDDPARSSRVLDPTVRPSSPKSSLDHRGRSREGCRDDPEPSLEPSTSQQRQLHSCRWLCQPGAGYPALAWCHAKNCLAPLLLSTPFFSLVTHKGPQGIPLSAPQGGGCHQELLDLLHGSSGLAHPATHGLLLDPFHPRDRCQTVARCQQSQTLQDDLLRRGTPGKHHPLRLGERGSARLTLIPGDSFASLTKAPKIPVIHFAGVRTALVPAKRTRYPQLCGTQTAPPQ